MEIFIIIATLFSQPIMLVYLAGVFGTILSWKQLDSSIRIPVFTGCLIAFLAVATKAIALRTGTFEKKDALEIMLITTIPSWVEALGAGLILLAALRVFRSNK